MPREFKYPWQAAYFAAIKESDPARLLCRVESAIEALTLRFAEWHLNPGGEAEENAIQEAIANLKKQMSLYERKRSA
jgi:hypothetical protein